MFFIFLHCVGIGEAQAEEEKHEPVFCVWHHTRRALREASQKSRSISDRREMEAFAGCLTNTAVASTLPAMSLQTWTCGLQSQNMSVSVSWEIGNLIVELENWGEITLM